MEKTCQTKGTIYGTARVIVVAEEVVEEVAEEVVEEVAEEVAEEGLVGAQMVTRDLDGGGVAAAEVGIDSNILLKDSKHMSYIERFVRR